MKQPMKNKHTLSSFLRSSLFWIVMVATIPFATVIAFSLLLIKVKTRHKILSQWGVLFAFLAKHICKVNYVIEGKENLIAGPAIIASNHQSTWETMAFNGIFPQHVWILKHELLRIPFFGWALGTLSPIAINRAQRAAALQQVLQQSVDRIAQGFWILVFPEGTRVAPGVTQPYKSGVSKMALSLQLPIIPVAHNAGRLMPRKSFFLHPGTITIKIGPPIYAQTNESPEELTERVRQVITANLNSIK
jgi:1-acyl-sn-glycerol-3-phosphate acyltransferase